MMLNYGSIISELRKNKNIPLNYLLNSKMNKSTYERFVKGETNISVDKFIYLIRKLRVDCNGFLNIYDNKAGNNRIFNYEYLVYEFEEAVLLNKIRYLLELKRKLIKINEYDKDEIYYHLLLLVIVNISYLQGETKFNDNESAEVLKNFLFNNEMWTKYELFIFLNSFFIFEYPALKTFEKQICHNLEQYNSLFSVKKMRIHIILKLIAFYIKNNKLKEAEHLITFLKRKEEQWNNYHLMVVESLTLYFLKCILIFIVDQDLTKKAEIRVIINLFENMGSEFNYKVYQSYFLSVCKNNLYSGE